MNLDHVEVEQEKKLTEVGVPGLLGQVVAGTVEDPNLDSVIDPILQMEEQTVLEEVGTPTPVLEIVVLLKIAEFMDNGVVGLPGQVVKVTVSEMQQDPVTVRVHPLEVINAKEPISISFLVLVEVVEKWMENGEIGLLGLPVEQVAQKPEPGLATIQFHSMEDLSVKDTAAT